MSNPALNDKQEQFFLQTTSSITNEGSTTTGVFLKTSLLFSILICSALFAFMLSISGYADKSVILSTIGGLGAFIVGLVVIFCKRPSWYAPLSLLYSMLEGLAIGSISASIAMSMGTPIVFGAISATLVTFGVMLMLYSIKAIKCTERFRSTVILATISIAVFYLLVLLVGLYNPVLVSFAFAPSKFGIGLSIFFCIVAALNLVIDFDLVDRITEQGAMKEFEWYAGFALMVTIVWLYLEILRLLAKMNSRR